MHIFYSGDVQGVGFRFTVERMAREFCLTGWVKNLSDGRVEMVCEGDEISVTNFIKRLNNRMAQNIADAQIDFLEYKGEFKEFAIKFY